MLVLKPVLAVDTTLIHSLFAYEVKRSNGFVQITIDHNRYSSTSLSRTVFCSDYKALWLILFSLNEIPSSSCDSPFTLLSIASSPYQVISGTNVHNSSKYTTMIHAQLFQCPFNNSKSISCGWYYQCSLKYCYLYKTHLYNWCVGKKIRLTSTL